MSVLAAVNRRRAARWRPPPAPLTVAAFAPTIRLPDGPAAGQQWDPNSEPVQRLWVEAVTTRAYRRFVAVCPSQRGKTLMAILLILLWSITQKRQSVGYVMPNLDKLAQNWEGKIKPSIEGAGFGAWLPTKGPGSKGGKPAVLTLRDPATGLIAGRTYFMATGKGGSETSVSSVSPAVILYDEADDAADAGQIELVFRRIESYGHAGLAVIASTVNDRVGRDAHPVLVIHSQGTRTRLHHRCPHCAAFFAPDLEHFDTTAGVITCPNCAVRWSEADRRAALNSGIMVHAAPDAATFSLLTTGLDYHMARLDDIAREYQAAKSAEGRSNFSLMRTHMQKVWCRPYEEPEAEGEISNRGLAGVSERSTYDKRMVPAWAQFLTMAQDVQEDRHYWMVVAHGPGERWGIVDFGYEHLVPLGIDGKPVRGITPADRTATLNLIRDLADAGWQVEGGELRMRPVMRGVDIGWETDFLASWVQGEPSWKAIRGVGHDEAKHVTGGIERPLPPEITRTKAIVVRRPPGWRIFWHRVDGHFFRRAAHAALLRDADAPASGMLPRGVRPNEMLCLHLSGEVWKDDKPGKPGYWFEVRKRHDLLDCLIYANALALLHRYAPERRDDGSSLLPARTRPRGNVGNYLQELS